MCKCCFGDIEGESCGWPKGTVRAVIALVTIPLAFAAAAAVIGVLMWKEQYTAATGVIGTIFGIVGTIIGYYFGSKQAEGAAKLISETEHDLIESRNQELKYGYRNMRYRDDVRIEMGQTGGDRVGGDDSDIIISD